MTSVTRVLTQAAGLISTGRQGDGLPFIAQSLKVKGNGLWDQLFNLFTRVAYRDNPLQVRNVRSYDVIPFRR